MSPTLEEKIVSLFEGVRIDSPKRHRAVISCRRDTLLSVLSFLKNEGFDHLALISCVDWIEEKHLELVYVLAAYMKDDESHGDREKTNILVKTRISRDDPVFLTSIPIFANAEPYEREIHELFGVRFEGHPRLTPLFLERAYDIPPFRKDFDTRNYVKDLFDNVPFVDKEADST
ncbi:MAG TPA: NADH-quinone oxidoreductase subunit C [Candidatus Eisenbacteria bacterium]|uniref:NADH-quinone oxidoreductase subunit C n=1 Tax=Eiseniibacteriota bacterium TaxID=2212470 RepID=A0A7V2ATP4_UNCEI|nr:NADH-quinone oxidoreductase subunit C [Candidatus Eisenbacteria bacterium]